MPVLRIFSEYISQPFSLCPVPDLLCLLSCWVVNFGAVPEALSGEQLYVQCSVGSQKASTDTTREHPPVWFTELCL